MKFRPIIGIALLLPACGSTSDSDLGRSLTDESHSAFDFVVTPDGSSVIASVIDEPAHHAWIDRIDIATGSAAHIYDGGGKPNERTQSYLRRGADGSIFFLEDSFDRGIDPSTRGTALLMRVSADGKDVRQLGVCSNRNFAEIAVAPDGKTVACSATRYEVQVIDAETGQERTLGVSGNAIMFSPDGGEILVGEGAGIEPNDGGLTTTLVRVAMSDPKAAPVPARYSGDELIGVRWDEHGLFALTRSCGSVKVEDLIRGTRQVLWQEPKDARIAYQWADSDHVFQVTGGACKKYKDFLGDCERAEFDMALRTLPTGAQQHLAGGEASSGGKAALLPCSQGFIWNVDDRLYVHHP